MKRPSSILRYLKEGLQYGDGVGLTPKECVRLIQYVEELEERVESAEAYAAKHAEMYVREQDRKGKEETNQ